MCIVTTPIPTVPMPTPTPLPGHPRITTVQNPILAGANFTIKGSGFIKGSVSTSLSALLSGRLSMCSIRTSAPSPPMQLTVPVPATIKLGQGFVSVVVINTDEGFADSNPGFAQLQGSAAAGLPSITGLNGHPLATTSLDPSYAVTNVETTLMQGSLVTINGTGFDTVHGAAVDVFCACPGGKLPTTLLQSRQHQSQIDLDHLHAAGDHVERTRVDHSEQFQRRELQRQERGGVGAIGPADNRDRRNSEWEDNRRWTGRDSRP
jgi:hypothetical protein